MTDPNRTELVLVIDQSGSMLPLQEVTIRNINEYADKQKALPGRCGLTLVFFNNEWKIPASVDLTQWVPLNTNTYKPSGTTEMLATIRATIDTVGQRLAALPEDQRPGLVLFVIVTDGEENPPKLKEVWDQTLDMVKHQRGVYKWQFVFLGANIDAPKVAQTLGVAANLASTYSATVGGTSKAYNAVNRVTSELRVTGKLSHDLSADLDD